MLMIRRSRDRLIFNMGIPISGKDGHYIETGHWAPDPSKWLLSTEAQRTKGHGRRLELEIRVTITTSALMTWDVCVGLSARPRYIDISHICRRFSVKWFTAIWNHNPSSTSLSSWKKNRSSYHCCFNWSVIIKIVNVVTGLAVVIINNSLIDCPQWSHGIYGGQFWRIFPHISYSNTCGVYMSLRPMCTPQYCCQIFWMVLVVYVNGLFIVRYM